MKPGATGDRAGLAALALAEGAPLPSAVGWDTTRDRCPAGCGGIATAFIEPLTGRTMEGCTKCDRAVVLTGRAAPVNLIRDGTDNDLRVATGRAPRKSSNYWHPTDEARTCEREGCDRPLHRGQRAACSRECRHELLRQRALAKQAERYSGGRREPGRVCVCGCGQRFTAQRAAQRYATRACYLRGVALGQVGKAKRAKGKSHIGTTSAGDAEVPQLVYCVSVRGDAA